MDEVAEAIEKYHGLVPLVYDIETMGLAEARPQDMYYAVYLKREADKVIAHHTSTSGARRWRGGAVLNLGCSFQLGNQKLNTIKDGTSVGWNLPRNSRRRSDENTMHTMR